MNDVNSTSDSCLLLIRIRPSREAATSGARNLSLEAEAILDYQSIYPATSFAIDLDQLQSSVASPNNAYGQQLGAQLCAAPSIQQALANIGQPDTLRLQLMLEGSGPHEAIRWERLAFPIRPGEPIAIRRDTPFSRFAAVDLPQDTAPEDTRFHLLVAIASPGPDEIAKFEVAPIEVADECAAILDACQDLLRNGQMQITFLPGKTGLPPTFGASTGLPHIRVLDGFTTAERIADSLNTVHGLHVIAHGRQGKRFNLVLEDENLGMLAWPDTQLIDMWQPRRLRLVFLQSCQSAAVRPANDPRPFVSGFMSQLVRAGAPAVVGMQDFVRIADAREFNRGFYTALVREGLVDEAANNGRRLLRQSIDAAWSIPAITTRLKRGAVWRESPLRAAQKKLRDRVFLERQTRSYPLFPIDVATVAADDLRKRSTDPSRDDIETVYPVSEGVRTDAFRALSEAVSQPVSGQVCSLIAAHGRAKTTLLEALYLTEVERHWHGEQPAIPVILRLADCAKASYDPERTFATAIASYFEVRAGVTLEPHYLLNCFDQQRFLFLINGDEDVGEGVLQQALITLHGFRNSRRTGQPDPHSYIVTLDQSAIKVVDLPEDSKCLIIQPMSVERVTAYLSSFAADDAMRQPAKVLLNQLSDGLWDLAEVPWLLSEMLDQASRGVLGGTRADILRRVVDERIAMISSASVVRGKVEDILCTLAWEMYSNRKVSLAGTDLFDLLMKLRGNRDYSLVEFRSHLIVPCRMMAPSEQDGLRFAYPGFRSYCCALFLYRQPAETRERHLEEITATLGRRSRAQLWEEVLLILAGFWSDTGTLLRMILSGVALSEGDQIYIAARCLQEARQAFGGGSSDEPVVRSIVSALIYRSHPRSLRSISTRRKAIEFLGPLKETNGVPHLVSLAIKKIRPDSKGKLTYDYSGIRLVAIKALLYAPEKVLSYVREDREWSSNTDLHDTLDAWLQFDGERLRLHLDSADEAVASIAAFALALTKLKGAHSALEAKFINPGNTPDFSWALTDALLELGDPALATLVSVNLHREDLQREIAYLIGKLGTARSDSAECKFLKDRLDTGDFVLRGRCLQSLAELRDTSVLDRCHKWMNDEDLTLRYYALQSARNIGNEQTLMLLTQTQWSAENDTATNGALSMERLRLEVYEEIYWRLAGGRSREVMVPIQHSRD
jgi:hypothetical protein